jgi:hypothetical protein
MKKIKLILGVLLLSTLSFGQTVDGITLGKPENDVTSKLIAKGFKLVERITPTMKKYEGKLSNGDNVDITIVSTPKTKLVWKLIISKKTYSWDDAKSMFESYKDKLIKKYGAATDDYRIFKTPFFDGDGYEMLSLYSDKCIWRSYWETLLIEIRSFEYGVAEIRICYENPEASKINNTEKEELDNKTF